MGKYRAGGQAVQCGERKAIVNRCEELLLAMPVGGRAEQFGPRGDPEADVHLPYRISSCKYVGGDSFMRLMQCVADRSCSMNIYRTSLYGFLDTSSWFTLWEAATAVYYKCVSRGLRGWHGGLGNFLTRS